MGKLRDCIKYVCMWIKLRRTFCIWGGMILRIPPKIQEEYLKYPCSPRVNQIFRAFKLCPFRKVKVVIIGQDPYPTKGEANGLAFSSNKETPEIIHFNTELSPDFEIKAYDLTPWAKRGVLLLNSCLTIKDKPEGTKEDVRESHRKDFGWEEVIENVLVKLNNSKHPIVFLLWGGPAIRLAEKLITNTTHKILKSSHPSNQGYKQKLEEADGQSFDGCDHFKKANEFLQKHGINPIDWNT